MDQIQNADYDLECTGAFDWELYNKLLRYRAGAVGLFMSGHGVGVGPGVVVRGCLHAWWGYHGWLGRDRAGMIHNGDNDFKVIKGSDRARGWSALT